MSNTHRRCKPGFRPSRLRQALHGMLLASALGVSVAAHAEESHGNTGRKSYHIAGGSLGHALRQFASNAGIFFTAESTLTDGKVSQGLDGEYTVAEGFRKLLAGSGLDYVFKDDRSVTLKVAESQPGAGSSTLPAVTVRGQAEYDSTDPYNTNYSIRNSTTATKTDAPIFDTPVTVQVVPRAVMDSQQAVRAYEALQNVSGVFVSTYGGGSSTYDPFIIRGFDAGNRHYRDGLRMPAQVQSMAGIQQIEVLKGPAAMLYGRLQPGGLINYVSKQPLATPYYSLQQQFGSYDLYRTTVDATGPIDSEGKLLYRANLEYTDQNSFVDFVSNERITVEPSLTWHISDATQLDFNFRYFRNEAPPAWGIPVIGTRPAPVRRSTYIGEPTDKEINSSYYSGVSLSHQFNEDWKIRARFAWNHNNYEGRYTGPNDFNEQTHILSRFFAYEPWEENILLGNFDLTGKFKTGSFEHTLLVGADSYYRNAQEDFFFLCDGCSNTFPNSIDIFNPQYGGSTDLALENLNAVNSPLQVIDEWYGIYFQDQIAFAQDWHFLFGGRYDWAANSLSFEPGGANPRKAFDDAFSPRVGLLYHPVPWLSLYGNWVRAMNNNNTGLSRSSQALDPETSEEYEFGLKGEWFDGRLSASVAYFDLIKRNIKRPLPGGLGRFELTGEAESEGVEIDVKGQVTEHWDLIATYSNTNTVITQGNNQGNRFPGVPENAGSLWTNYELGALGLPGLKFGAGVYLAGQRQGDAGNSFQLPGYGRLDLAASYARHFGGAKATIQLNAINVLDKGYFVSAADRLQAFYAVPMTLMGSIRLEF